MSKLEGLDIVIDDVQPDFIPISIEITIHTRNQLATMLSMFAFASSTVLQLNSFTPAASYLFDTLKAHDKARK